MSSAANWVMVLGTVVMALATAGIFYAALPSATHRTTSLPAKEDHQPTRRIRVRPKTDRHLCDREDVQKRARGSRLRARNRQSLCFRRLDRRGRNLGPFGATAWTTSVHPPEHGSSTVQRGQSSNPNRGGLLRPRDSQIQRRARATSLLITKLKFDTAHWGRTTKRVRQQPKLSTRLDAVQDVLSASSSLSESKHRP